MSELIRRLRDPAFGTETSERNLMNQAADEIDRLRAALRDAICSSCSGIPLALSPNGVTFQS